MEVDHDIGNGNDNGNDNDAKASTSTSPSKAKSSNKYHKTGIELLKIIHSARQTYGLRTNDYARYHAHCVRRVSTLHRATGTVHRPVTSSSSSSNAKKGAQFQGKTNATSTDGKAKSKSSKSASSSSLFKSTTSQVAPEDVLKDERLLELLLWEGERAWSEAMREREQVAFLEQQKQSSQQKQSKSKASQSGLAHKRHRYLKRFSRACQHSQKLSAIAKKLWHHSSDSFSPSSAFQIEIYHQYMQGTYDFAKISSSSSSVIYSNTTSKGKESSTSPLLALSNAYNLLEGYAQYTQSATEEALAFELLDELEPMIRFCAYKIGSYSQSTAAEIANTVGQSARDYLQAKDSSFPGVAEKLQKDEKAFARNRKTLYNPVHKLSWRDIDIPIRSAELAEALGKVKYALGTLIPHSQSQQNVSQEHILTSNGQAAGSNRISSLGPSKQLKVSAYEKGLAILIEAEDRAHKLVEDNSTALAKAHSARFEAASRPLALAHSYIAFQLYCVRLHRDNALLQNTLQRLTRRENKVQHDDSSNSFGTLSARLQRRRLKLYPTIIKLLDVMIQTLETARELDVVEQDTSDLADQVEVALLRHQAMRCRYLGETYALINKFPEAEALLQRGHLYLRQLSNIRSSISSNTVEDASGLESLVPGDGDLDSLTKQLSSASSRVLTDWYVFSPSEKKTTEISEDTDLNGTLGGLTLNVNPRGNARKRKVKRAGPVFFDVAFNYVAAVDHETLTVEVRSQVPFEASRTYEPSIDLRQPAATQEQVRQEEAEAEVESGHAGTPDTSKKSIWGFFSRSK